MPDQDDLIGSQMDVEQIRGHIAANSLAYLSHEGMVAATEIPGEDFCTACFSSRYPVPIPVHELRNKHVLEQPLDSTRSGYDRA
jgi:amidophosphoribosyltransferase